MKSYAIAAAMSLAAIGTSADAVTLAGTYSGLVTTGSFVRTDGTANIDLAGKTFSAEIVIDPDSGAEFATVRIVAFSSRSFFASISPPFTYANGLLSGGVSLNGDASGRIDLLADIVNGQPTNWRGSYRVTESTFGNVVSELNATFDSLTFDGTLTGLPAVPEPATWAMMIAGFGMAGAAMRRRLVPQAA